VQPAHAKIAHDPADLIAGHAASIDDHPGDIQFAGLLEQILGSVHPREACAFPRVRCGARDPATTGYSDYGSLGDYTVTVEVAAGDGDPDDPPTPPANDDFAFAKAVKGRSVSVAGTTLGASRQQGEPDHYTPVPGDVDWSGDHTVWYRWKAPASGQTTIDTCTANIDSILAVYTGKQLNALNRVADNNNGCSSGFGSKVVFSAKKDKTYRIAVGDAGGAAENTFTLNVQGP
jgi:hypothetical protein